MNKVFKKLLLFVIIIAFFITACGTPGLTAEEPYSMNVLYTLGGSLEKTKITYEVTIEGPRENIRNIDAFEVLVNTDYLDMMLENGPHHSEQKLKGTHYLKITGSFVFSTAGKNKEEIGEIKFLDSIKLIDKNNSETLLSFHP